jgi:8-oxo-dGTP diphosphatase
MQLTQVILTADIIIEYEDSSIVLVKRKNEPCKDMWALPGGMLDGDETIETTAVREAKEETGLDVQLGRSIGVYSKPGRDPRGRYVSVAYTAKPIGGELKAADDAKEIQRTKGYAAMQLAFDHNQILTDYLNSKR